MPYSLDIPILEAKFRIPSLMKATVGRPRLFARLDEAADCRLLVITAPAGFGKTTLVTSWLLDRSSTLATGTDHACERHYAWLSLDERENRPAVFLGQFVGAIQHTCAENHFHALNLLQPPTYPAMTDLARALITDLERLNCDVTLVLDDYHVISEPQVHALVDTIIAYAPERFRLVILARHDPPLPVARLCLQGRARQLRANDLRFRPAEAEAFLAAALPHELPRETVKAVIEEAGGWIAQLRLAALLMQQAPDQATRDTVRHLAMDYLMEELLASEPAPVRTVLLATSVLERFCAPLVEALFQPSDGANSGQANDLQLIPLTPGTAAQALNHVVQAGLFVTDLDSGRLWYRYHDLFRELLYQRLQSDHAADVLVLRRRALVWLQQRGLVEEAIAQARAIGDEPAVADLVEANVLAAIQSYQWQSAQRWLEMLSPAAVNARPALLLAQGYSFLNSGSVERVGVVIRRTESLLKAPESFEPDAQERVWRGTLALLRAEYFFMLSRLDECRSALNDSLELLPPDCLFERSFAVLRAQSLLAHDGKSEEGRELLRGLLREADDDRVPWVTRVRIGLALSYARDGQFRRAEYETELAQQVYSRGQAYNECWAHYILGRIAYEWNDLNRAAEHFRSASRSPGGNDMRACESLLGLALTREARGEREPAAQAIEQALAMAKALRSEDLVTLVLSCRTRLLLMRGELAAGFTELTPSAAGDRLTMFMPIELPRLTEASRLLADGKPAELREAQRLMEDMVNFLAERHLVLALPRAQALLAAIYRARDQRMRASETLAKAVQIGASGGFIRSFLDLGPQLLGLLYELKLTGAAGDHVAAILAAAAASRELAETAKPQQQLIEPLTPRELEVLELVAANLADKEIAAALCISPLTVRKHTANIFAKLQVRNRRQASTRSIELGLVTPQRVNHS